MKDVLSDLGIEYRGESQYATACPKCSGVRKKHGTRSLQVYINDGEVSFKCFHKGQCEWDTMQKIKIDTVEDKETREEISLIPFPRGYTLNISPQHIAYPYSDRDGNVLFYIIRTPEKKFFPVSWGTDGNEYCRVPKQKVLYRSEHLHDDGRPVVVVEGEKTADAAAKIFTKADVVTWRGGANNVKSGDWDLLTGRTVVLFPDNDDAGRMAMSEIKELIVTDQCFMVDTSILQPKQDLADDIPLEIVKKMWAEKQLVSKPILQGMMQSDALLDMYKETAEGFPFGYPKMDKLLRIPERGLCVINGRTNHGKSLFMVNIAANLLRNTDAVVIYLSYELTIAETNLRLIKAMHGKCYSPVTYEDDKYYKEKINSGEISEIEEIRKYIEAKRFMLTDKPISISEIKDTFKALHIQGKRAILFIDYLQLIPSVSTSEARYLEIKKIVETLRQLSLEYGHVIIGGSQLTEGETPRQDQSREGKDIMFTAALVLKLWNKTAAKAQGAVKRTRVKDPDTNQYVEQEVDHYNNVYGDFIVDVLKTRQGQSGKCFGFNIENGNRLVEATLTSEEF